MKQVKVHLIRGLFPISVGLKKGGLCSLPNMYTFSIGVPPPWLKFHFDSGSRKIMQHFIFVADILFIYIILYKLRLFFT